LLGLAALAAIVVGIIIGLIFVISMGGGPFLEASALLLFGVWG
jgi:hypothetical protein